MSLALCPQLGSQAPQHFRSILSRYIVNHSLFLYTSPPGDRWRDVVGFVPAGWVSSSSTLQIYLLWAIDGVMYLALCPLLGYRVSSSSTLQIYPFKVHRQPLPFSVRLSSRRSMAWCPSLALCPQRVVFQAPQHFRSSETQVQNEAEIETCRRPTGMSRLMIVRTLIVLFLGYLDMAI